MSMAARDANGATIQAIRPGTAQKLNFTATSAQSVAVGADTTLVRLLAQGADCRVAFGSDPTAVAADTLILAGVGEYFAIKPNEKIAALRDAGTSGTLNITEAANY